MFRSIHLRSAFPSCLLYCVLTAACVGTPEDTSHHGLLGGGGGMPCGTPDGGGGGGGGGSDGGSGSSGDNLVLNGDFSSDLDDWTPNVHTGTGTISITTTSSTSPPATGGKVVKIVNAVSQEAYKVQIYQDDLEVSNGHCYQISFYAKAEAAKKFAVGLGKQTPDWRSYGLWVEPRLGYDWKQYLYKFTASATANDARLSLNFGTANTTILLDDIDLEEMSASPCP